MDPCQRKKSNSSGVTHSYDVRMSCSIHSEQFDPVLTLGLELSRSPYSKSHERRLKRRAKEQIAGGLSDLQSAISAIEDSPSTDSKLPDRTTSMSSSEQKRKAQVEPDHSTVGGKSAPLSKAQRKRVLYVNPQGSSYPD